MLVHAKLKRHRVSECVCVCICVGAYVFETYLSVYLSNYLLWLDGPVRKCKPQSFASQHRLP